MDSQEYEMRREALELDKALTQSKLRYLLIMPDAHEHLDVFSQVLGDYFSVCKKLFDSNYERQNRDEI